MPKIVDRDVYRIELMSKAFHIFAERGYGIPIRSLAKEMGVSTGTLYHYFPGKRELFEQMTLWLAQRTGQAEKLQASEGLSLEQRLAVIAEVIMEGSREMVAMILLSVEYARLTEEDQATEFFNSMFKDYAKQIFVFLKLPPEICQLMMAAADGILLYGSVTQSEKGLRDQINLLMDMVLVYEKARIARKA